MTTLSVAEANALIAVDKITVREMVWIAKNTNHNPKFQHFETAIKIDNEVREDVYFRAIYRPEHAERKGNATLWANASIGVALHASNHRISAIDFDDSKLHINKKGQGLPHYQAKLIGLHRHIWTNDGYGYAEPMELENIRLETIINAFIKENNIQLIGGFKPLPQEQLQLLL